MWPSSGQWPTRASPWRGTMVYWHDDTGAATAGKHKSDVCSEISRKRELHRCWSEYFNDCREEVWGALTLFGPGSPKAEGDEGDDDEYEGSQDNTNYEVGEVAGPRHQSSGVSPHVVWGLYWIRPLVVRTSWGDKTWKKIVIKKKKSRDFAASSTSAWQVSVTARFPPHLSFQGSPRCQIHSLPSRWSSASWCRRRSQAGGRWLSASICPPPPHPSYSHCHCHCLSAGSRCRNRRWACCLQECTVGRNINHVTITMDLKYTAPQRKW